MGDSARVDRMLLKEVRFSFVAIRESTNSNPTRERPVGSGRGPAEKEGKNDVIGGAIARPA